MSLWAIIYIMAHTVNLDSQIIHINRVFNDIDIILILHLRLLWKRK